MPGYLFAFVDDGDRRVQFELGSLDEVGEVLRWVPQG